MRMIRIIHVSIRSLPSLNPSARIVSVMIAGPARFPVARMEKYNRWEHASTERLLAFFEALNRPPAQPRTELDYGIEAKEYDLAGVTVKHNAEQNRLQLIFPGKPDDETRERLKKRGLMHPLLVDHPFVQHVQSVMGIEIDSDGAPNKYGYRSGGHAMWWHAVDLVTAGLWKELLETERFTTPDLIAGAVSFGLQHSRHDDKRRKGYISTVEARKILKHIDAREPDDRAKTLRQLMRPSSLKEEKGSVRWPINMASPSAHEETAWCLVLGIETGWFGYDRSGFLQWTQAGRDRYTSVVGIADGFNAKAADRWRPPDLEEPDEEPASDEDPPAPKAIQLDLFG